MEDGKRRGVQALRLSFWIDVSNVIECVVVCEIGWIRWNSLYGEEGERYDKEHIQVSIMTVCANPRKLIM